MNNGVNNSNNLNSQNNVVPAVPTVPQGDNNLNTTANVQQVVQATLEVVTTPVVDEANMALQTIPGVVVAPPQNNGMDKPNPIQPLPAGAEVATTPEQAVPVQQVVPEAQVTPPVVENQKKKKSKFPLFLILIILLLIGYIVFLMNTHKEEIARLNDECTPVSTAKDAKELELDSTIVVDLYSKVKTSLREDLAEMELSDQMKLYLAFRQIPASKFYESNCNLFSDTSMEPYKCVTTATKFPLAFKEEDLQIEVKKLFGEKVVIPNGNVQLGAKNCIGGYQYIAERGEFVQGDCINVNSTIYKMDKNLIRAESKESTIMLYEEVKYYNVEGIDVPEKLKSGTYVYTFKLDTNYNYVYVSKTLQN